jgi:branched-chain amino acid transport system permease protein
MSTNVAKLSTAERLGWPVANKIGVSIVVLLALCVPFVVSGSYWLGTLTLALIIIVLNQSWNLVLGYSGVWNFGQLAIYAIGGYAAGSVSLHTSLPWPLAMVVGGLSAMAVSLVLALPTLRLRGIYVSLLTFGFAEVIRLLIISDQSGLTGGTFGLSGFKGFGLADVEPQLRQRYFYWIALSVALLSSAVCYRLIRSHVGNGLIALRESPALAAARGLNPVKYQLVAFGVSGLFAGFAGSLYAFNFGVVGPSIMGIGPMTLFVTMMVVGGMGTQTGPILGTLIVAIASTSLEEWPEIRLIVFSLLLLLIVLLAPRGFVPVIGSLRKRISNWVSE